MSWKPVGYSGEKARSWVMQSNLHPTLTVTRHSDLAPDQWRISMPGFFSRDLEPMTAEMAKDTALGLAKSCLRAALAALEEDAPAAQTLQERLDERMKLAEDELKRSTLDAPARGLGTAREGK